MFKNCKFVNIQGPALKIVANFSFAGCDNLIHIELLRLEKIGYGGF